MRRTKQCPPPSRSDPTADQWGAYRLAFDYFNGALFGGTLPAIMLNFSRRARAMGFFAPERWRRGDAHTHEISLNPDVLDQPLIGAMATLVHEQVHLWQREFGKPSRTGYHNREWADKMEAIGLMPSDTGKPGGKRVGQRMSDYPIAGGLFEAAFGAMPEACRLPWLSGGLVDKPGKPPRADKVKYACGGCGVNVWGKSGLNVACIDCGRPMDEDEGRGEG